MIIEKLTPAEKALNDYIIDRAKQNIKKDNYVPLKWLMFDKDAMNMKENMNVAFIIACEMVSTYKYKFIDVPHNKSDIGVMKNTWDKAHPYRFAAILGFIGLIFAIVAGILNAVTGELIKDNQANKKLQQEYRTNQELRDSLTNLQIYLNNNSISNLKKSP